MFVKLTHSYGFEILVNLSLVECMHLAGEDDGSGKSDVMTLLIFASGQQFMVRELPEEIGRRAKEADR